MTPNQPPPPGDAEPDRGARPQIDVVSAAHVPACPHCDRPGLIAARVPHPIQRPDGHLIHGTTTVVLCPHCDADHPTAGPLITYFHVHNQVDDDTLTQAADLIAAWVTSISIPPPSPDQIDAEADAWRRGEL